MSYYDIPGMTIAECAIFARLTEDEQRNVHYEGWSAVWDKLTECEQNALIEDFELYGDR